MNSNNIYQYILNLEIENTKLKNDNNILKNKNDELINELTDFKKVSIMVNFNKQLKEKENQVNFLENQVRNLKNKIYLENDKSTNLENTDINLDKSINSKTDKINKKKKVKEYQIIKYKNKDYLLNLESNEIFESDDIKLHNKIGILSKGKIKFNS